MNWKKQKSSCKEDSHTEKKKSQKMESDLAELREDTEEKKKIDSEVKAR